MAEGGQTFIGGPLGNPRRRRQQRTVGGCDTYRFFERGEHTTAFVYKRRRNGTFRFVGTEAVGA